MIEHQIERGHHPDKWVLIDYTSKVGKPEYSLMCGWYGGFAGADSWRRSSPIVSVEHIRTNDASVWDGWVATTGSGTKYFLYPGTISVSMLTSGLLEQASLDYMGSGKKLIKFLRSGAMFKVGDKVKFKKSSIDSGMIDATEDDVFKVVSVHEEHWGTLVKLEGIIRTVNISHLEHVKEEIVNTTEEQEIKWEIGQEVWCILKGSGKVCDYTKEEYPVKVLFSSGEEISYTQCGRMMSWDKNRTLFFSEPKIEAEKFPPKKPFVPKLKKGDVILVKVKDELYGEGTVRTVHSEIDDRIYISEDHHYFLKKDILSIRVLSEEIIFN